MKLTELVNIGNNLECKLKQVGINSAEKLKIVGAENAFVRIKTVDKTVCINMLYALEGAIQEIRWHKITKERKTELLDFYKSL